MNEKTEAEIENLLGEIMEDRKLLIQCLLEIKSSIMQSIKLIDEELESLVGYNLETTEEE